MEGEIPDVRLWDFLIRMWTQKNTPKKSNF